MTTENIPDITLPRQWRKWLKLLRQAGQQPAVETKNSGFPDRAKIRRVL